MDIAFDLLLIVHFVAFAVGITTTIAMPMLMGVMPRLQPEARAVVGGLAPRFARNARLAFLALIASGVGLTVLRYGGVEAMDIWFWVKMALVVVVAGAILVQMLAPGRLDPRLMSWVTRLAMLGIVISAVLAFH